MENYRYITEQVAYGLRQAEKGTPVVEVCRKMVISERPPTAGRISSRGWAWPRCVACGSWRRRSAT